MKFDWTVRTIGEWREWLKRSTQSNWMQNWSYAQATFAFDKLRTRMALLRDDQNSPIGMVAVQELKLGPIQIINIKRGPLWFTAADESNDVEFSKELRKEFPKSLFQRLRWIPARELSGQSIAEIKKEKYKVRKETFRTKVVNLKDNIETIRSKLNQKWRNCLNKAEKQKIEVVIDDVGDTLIEFIKGYHQHKTTKKFHGPSPRFLSTELQQSCLQSDCIIILCKKDSKVVAGGAFTITGQSMSYRAGWSTEEGRQQNAGYLILWRAVEQGKNRQLDNLDLGGILPEEAPGVTKFKEGFSSKSIRLITLG
jgi:Acetyltransferase (GNAT) domain